MTLVYKQIYAADYLSRQHFQMQKRQALKILFACRKTFFQKLTIWVLNSLDPDQAQHFLGSDLGPSWLQIYSKFWIHPWFYRCSHYTCKIEKDPIKNKGAIGHKIFPIITLSESYLLPLKPEFWSDLAQNLMQPKTFPTPIMLQMKFDFDQPAGLRELHVWKC